MVLTRLLQIKKEDSLKHIPVFYLYHIGPTGRYREGKRTGRRELRQKPSDFPRINAVYFSCTE